MRASAGSPLHDNPAPCQRLILGAAGTGKTQLLIDRLLARRRADADAWNTTVVWTRTAIAAELFTRRLEAAACECDEWRDGYPPMEVTTAAAWARRVLARGLYGIAPKHVWPPWIEREAIRAACVEQAGVWPEGGDKLSADVPAYHEAVRQWAGTLALNGSTPARWPAGLDAPNAHRAHRLAAVLQAVDDRKRNVGALGEHNVFPELLRACEDEDILKRWRAATTTLVIDDAQDLPVQAARLAAAWAQGGGELWVALDPDSPTARFQGAIPEEGLRVFRDFGLEEARLDRPAAISAAASAGAVLCGRATTTDAPDRERLVCVRTADEIEEVYELARRVRHAVYDSRDDERPLRYADCAIVAQSLQRTGAYLADALTFYDVPFIQRIGAALANTPVVRYALDYLLTLDSPGDAFPMLLAATGFSGLPHSPVEVRLTQCGRTGDATKELAAWEEQWRALRERWRKDRRLAPVLYDLSGSQLLPALVRSAEDGEAHAHHWEHLRQLLGIAEDLDDHGHSGSAALDALARVAREENAAEEWDAAALDRDAVRILTPFAARDLRFRWLAVAGFTSGRWPPPPRAHVLHLDRATEGRLGRTPLTLWTPDADTHDREWRQLAATALERCDDELVLSVPAESTDGEPLDPSGWLDELGDLVREEPPLADPARGLSIDAALTSAELDAARTAMGLAETPAATAGQPAVDVSDRRVSASLLNTFLECPRRCFYTRLLNVADESPELTAAGQFGSMMHAVLQHLHGQWRAWSAADANAMKAQAVTLLAAAWAEKNMAAAYENPLQHDRMRMRAEDMLTDYVDWLVRECTDVEQVVAIEAKVEFIHDGARVTGVIDRVDRLRDGRYRVVDFKTGGTTQASGATVAKGFVDLDGKDGWAPADLQLPTYRLALPHLDTLRAAAAETALCFLRTDPSKPPKFATVVWDGTSDERGMRSERFALTSDECIAAQETVDTTLARFRTGLFAGAPARTQSCARCVALNVCNQSGATAPEGP